MITAKFHAYCDWCDADGGEVSVVVGKVEALDEQLMCFRYDGEQLPKGWVERDDGMYCGKCKDPMKRVAAA